MTNVTTELSQTPATTKRGSPQTAEYRVYLALIFMAALPFCAVIWVYALFRHMTLPSHGPIQMALAEARTITPCIFWG